MAVCSSLGFIALPGGYGVRLIEATGVTHQGRFKLTEYGSQTFEEVMEMVTWTQLRIREFGRRSIQYSIASIEADLRHHTQTRNVRPNSL